MWHYAKRQLEGFRRHVLSDVGRARESRARVARPQILVYIYIYMYTHVINARSCTALLPSFLLFQDLRSCLAGDLRCWAADCLRKLDHDAVEQKEVVRFEI